MPWNHSRIIAVLDKLIRSIQLFFIFNNVIHNKKRVIVNKNKKKEFL